MILLKNLKAIKIQLMYFKSKEVILYIYKYTNNKVENIKFACMVNELINDFCTALYANLVIISILMQAFNETVSDVHPQIYDVMVAIRKYYN